MHDIVGQRLRHIKEPFSNGKKVIKVENDTVYFEDNARAPLSAIDNVFEVVTSGNVPETYKQVDVNSVMNINQNQNPQNNNTPMNTTNESVDPSNFFTNNSSTLLDLASKIKNIDTNQMSGQPQGGYVSQAQPPQILPVGGEIPYNPNDPDINANLSPSTVQNLKQQMNQNQQKPLPPDQDPAVLAQFGNNVDDGGSVRKVNNDDIKNDLKQANEGVSVTQSNYINDTPTQSTNPSFPKMKKNTKVVIKLEIEEMIPKPESVKSLNDLFEESIIDVLAKEITQNLLKDPKLVEDMVVEELERIIYKKKKTARKKPATKKPTTKKDPVAKKVTLKKKE